MSRRRIPGPIEHWNHRELADEVLKRKIVLSISISGFGSFLKDADLQSRRSKYLLNTTKKCEETFKQQVEIVCQTYLEAPALYIEAKTHTVSVDEMPGIQATEQTKKRFACNRESLSELNMSTCDMEHFA